MDCSVVITTFNRAQLLEDTLRAIARQSTSPDLQWEIVVVDNNSTDQTRERTLAVAKDSPVPVRYFLETQQGQSYARNTGVERSSGEWVVFTDDDVLPERDWLTRIVKRCTEQTLDGVGGRVLPHWDDPPPDWLLARRDLQMWLAVTEEEDGGLLSHPMSVARRLVGASMAFRRTVFQEFGGFDPSLGHRGNRLFGGEEVEFINRLLLAGRRIAYDPSIVVHHRIDKSRMQKSFFLRKLFEVAMGQIHGKLRAGTPVPDIQRWEYRRFMTDVLRTIVHTALRRPDAFSRQLNIAMRAGTLWATRQRKKRGTSVHG